MPINARSAKGGFTLAEILCALAVLSILVLMIAQLMSGAAKTMNFNENRMGVEGQMRTVYASMSNDLSNMIKKSNVDVLFSKQAGNDYMFFYSEAEADFTATTGSSTSPNASPFSIVGYRVWPYQDPVTNRNLYRLERYSRGLTWDNSGNTPTAGPIYYTYAHATSTPQGYTNFFTPTSYCAPDADSTLVGGPWSSEIPNGSDTATDTNFHGIAPGVFRLEFCFLHTDGTFSDSPQIPPANSGTPPEPSNRLDDVVALVVSLVELDPASQRTVPDMSVLVNAFADSDLGAPVKQPQPVAETWQNVLNNNRAQLIGEGIPAQVIPKIRVYQHFFYLNND